jgi:hypothetical protein
MKFNERRCGSMAGFFMLRQEIFEHLRDGEELVCEPFSG